MVANNLLEVCVSNIAAKLEAIRTTDGYSYSRILRSVQRHNHDFPSDGFQHITNYLQESPTIIIRTLDEDIAGDETIDRWTHRQLIDIWFVVTAGAAGDVALNNAATDMLKALFAVHDGFGVNARLVSMRFTRVDPVLEMPTNGVHLLLNLMYGTVIGDPTQAG